MLIDHAYPDLEKDEENDLLALYHMDNETLITEFFGFIKSADYVDLDPVDHLEWRNDERMKEKSATDELTKLAEFKATRNEWFTEEEENIKRSRKTTPKVQEEEGSSSQPRKKRQKKVVETLLVDEPEEDELEANAEIDQERLSFETEQLLKTLNENLESEKVAGEEGDNEEKSSSDSEVDETEHWKKVISEKEKHKKRKRSGDDDDKHMFHLQNMF
ncbi:hypothetical protein Hanom_Chr08g00746721 [Helianthus anomalus]